jgi:Fe2+ transport system protein B
MAFRTNLRFSGSLAVFSMAALFVIYRNTVWKIGLCPRIVYLLLCAEVMISGLVLLASKKREVCRSEKKYRKYLNFYIFSICLVSPCIATLDYLAKGQEIFFVPLTAAVFCGLCIPPIYGLVLPFVS